MLNNIAIIIHLIVINIWVGGMFFIIIVLGKVVATLDVSEQHVFWLKVYKRFFFWLWIAVIGLLASGSGMIFYRFGSMANTPWYIIAMAGLGISMMVIFMAIYFVFYKKFTREFNAGNIEASGHQLRIIRRLGIVNMLLGFCVVVVIGAVPFS